MYLFFYVALGLNDLDAGKSITQAIGRGGPWNLDFLGPQMALASLVAISAGPKKVSISGPNPSNGPRNG